MKAISYDPSRPKPGELYAGHPDVEARACVACQLPTLRRDHRGDPRHSVCANTPKMVVPGGVL